MSSESKHPAIRSLEFSDGELTWGGQRVSALADSVGRTPFFAYDTGRIRSRVAELRNALPREFRVHYAMKANPMPEIVQFVSNLVDGLDVASQGELEVALGTDVARQDISFAGPGKTDSELRAAVLSDITINLESAGEMRRLARVADKEGRQPHVAIRVNPTFELKSAGMKMGGRPSQFGVDAEQVPAMLDELKNLDLKFRGFHVFSGSQNLRADAIAESLGKTVDLVIQLASVSKLPIEWVNVGGGLGIPYFPHEQSIDMTEVSESATRAATQLLKELGDIEIVTELGRFLVGEAGIYVARVIDIKESRGSKFAICDGGLHHHLAASGNFGQVIRKNYPVVAVEARGEVEQLTLVGPLCTPLDLLGDRISVDKLSEGSLVAILQSGAYGRSASPAGFLSHPDCAEIIC